MLNIALRMINSGKRCLYRLSWLALVLHALFPPAPARASAPRYVSDRELAEYPIIVVAKWDGTPFRPNHRTKMEPDFWDEEKETEVITVVEFFTRMDILRVIRGDVRPGTHTLRIGGGISWSPDGTYVNSCSSTELPGDVYDVKVPNLWFLKRERSWDPSDKTNYLSVWNYREIQPLELDEFYQAVNSRTPDRPIARLLRESTNSLVMVRLARLIGGGRSAWPYGSDEAFERVIGRDKARQQSLTKHADALGELLDRDVGPSRVEIASIYVALKKEESIPLMRRFLQDPNPAVRCVAIGAVVKYADTNSWDTIAQSVQVIDDSWLARALVELLGPSTDLRLLRALVEFLEHDGADWGEPPAVLARNALHQATGHWFPFNVQQARAEWLERAPAFHSPPSPIEPDVDGNPFEAEFVGTPAFLTHDDGPDPDMESSLSIGPETSEPLPFSCVQATVRITNRSTHPAGIAKQPDRLSQESRGLNHSEYMDGRDLSPDDYITLAPGETLSFQVFLRPEIMIPEPGDRTIELSYVKSGHEIGLSAWIGRLPVRFGSAWEENRVIEQVEELWPNGNLKISGQRVYGMKFGEWHHFNEQGDRIAIMQYASNQGSAQCNPDHPDNKGAGIRHTP